MRFITAICTLAALVAFAVAPAFAGGASSALVDVLHNKGVIDDASYNDLKKTEGEGGQQALDKKLIEVLHNKGVIDDASYSQLSAQAAAAPAAPAAPQASAAPAERPIEKVLSSIEEGFVKAGGDTVKIKLGTWFQGGFVSDTNGSNTGTFPGLVGVNKNSGNQFYNRIARIYFNATMSDKVGMRITLDGVGPVLQDAYLWTDYIPYTRLTIGQYLIPFGDEYWRAPFDLPMINYSMASTMLFVNQNEPSGSVSNYVRDIGVMANVKYATKLGNRPFGVNLITTVINGAGKNLADVNDHKDWVGRVTVNPFVPGLSVGGSWYLGKSDVQESLMRLGGSASVFHQQDIQRWGAELDYAPPYLKGFALRGEYLYQRQFFTNGFTPSADHSQTPTGATLLSKGLTPKYFQSAGWHVDGLYRINGIEGPARFLNGFEPTLRYEEFYEDLSVDNKDRAKTIIGLNYWLNKYTRLLANYEIIKAESGLRTFTIYPNGIDTNDHQVFTMHYQVWF